MAGSLWKKADLELSVLLMGGAALRIDTSQSLT